LLLMGDTHLGAMLKNIVIMSVDVVNSDSALESFVRENCTTIFHPVGTAKMGPETDRWRWSITIAGCAASRDSASSMRR
jgi:hypothetical protein